MKKSLHFILLAAFLSFASICFSQNSSNYKKNVIINNYTCQFILTIKGQSDYRIQFSQVFPVQSCACQDTLNTDEISPEVIRAFLEQSVTFDSVKARVKKNYNKDVTSLDSLSHKLYYGVSSYLSDFFNDKTADNLGMTADKFAEMEVVEGKIEAINLRLDSIIAFRHHQKNIKKVLDKEHTQSKANTTQTKAEKKTQAKAEKQRITNERQRVKDRIVLLRADRRQLARQCNNIKKQNTKPIIFLSGTAFAFLNKNVNNDSIKSDIMAAGIHATKDDLWDLDAKITVGQNEDVIKSSDRNTFGSTILVPGIRRFSFLSNCRWGSIFPYTRHEFINKIGWNMAFNISQVQWQWSGHDSMHVNGSAPVRLVPVAIDLCLNYNWLNAEKNKVNLLTNVKMSTDVGLTGRGVAGNLGLSRQLLMQFTGNANQVYIGLLIGFRVQVERMSIYYSGAIFPNAFYGNTPGLTGGQIVSNIGLRADIFQYKQTKN